MTMKAVQPQGQDQQQPQVCLSRSEVFTSMGGAMLGAAALLTLAPQPADAEMALANRKQSYFRYAPRIKSAEAFFAKDFKAAIDKKDWAAVSKAFELEAQAPSTSMRGNPQRFVNKFEKDLYSPMKIYSQSFAEKGTSPKLTAMLKAEGEMEAAINRIQLVAKGNLKPAKAEGGGFFGFGGGGGDDTPDKYAGLSQEKMAAQLWSDAKESFNEWVDIVNKALSVELNKFEPI
jgi:hypothetical protein